MRLIKAALAAAFVLLAAAPAFGQGRERGMITVVGTGGSVSHTAGQSVGGVFAIPLGRQNTGSGIVTNFMLIDAGGSITALLVRIWQKNPSGSTCNDNAAFVSNAADDAHLIVPPFTVTPAAPANTTGDAKTYASVAGVTWDYQNPLGDVLVYVCLITQATQTIAGTNQRVGLSGPAD